MNIEKEKARLSAMLEKISAKQEKIRSSAEAKLLPLDKKSEILKAQLALLSDHSKGDAEKLGLQI